MEKRYIKDFQEDEHISAYFAVFEKHIRQTRSGKDYLDLLLGDRGGKIRARVWDQVAELSPKFEVGDAVAVKAQVVVFNEEYQLNISNIRQVEKDIDAVYGYTIDDIIPTTEKNIDQLWESVQNAIQSITDVHLRKLTATVYQKYEDQLRTHPGSMILHHAYRGGLLEHISAMCRMVVHACEVYPEVNRDLVVAGVLLHDIGKLRELDAGLTTIYSDTGNLIGHLVLGRDIVRETIAEMETFPPKLQSLLEHIILAHQGRYEWQSPREPEFLEALLVYHIDEIDTRMNQMKTAIDADHSEGDWTSRSNYFHLPLYKGQRGEGEK